MAYSLRWIFEDSDASESMVCLYHNSAFKWHDGYTGVIKN